MSSVTPYHFSGQRREVPQLGGQELNHSVTQYGSWGRFSFVNYKCHLAIKKVDKRVEFVAVQDEVSIAVP